MAKSKSGANVIKPAGQFIAWAVLIIITMLTAYIMIKYAEQACGAFR